MTDKYEAQKSNKNSISKFTKYKLSYVLFYLLLQCITPAQRRIEGGTKYQVANDQ